MIGRCRSGCSHSGVHGRVRYGDAMPPDNEVEVDTAESERIDALLRELDAEDLEFLEPPTSIWKAISATVDAERDADVMHLLGTEDLGRIDLPGIQDLAAQRHDRLRIAVARLLGGSAGGITFDEEDLAQLWFL